MLIVIIAALVVCGGGGTGLVVHRVRKRRARTLALNAGNQAADDAAAAEGRQKHPTVQELLLASGFRLLDRPLRPTPQLHGSVLCTEMTVEKYEPLRCKFDHSDIHRARHEGFHRDDLNYRRETPAIILLLEQVVATGTRAEYHKICHVCQLCLHITPIESPQLEGTAFEHALGDKQSLAEVVHKIDPAEMLEKYHDWLKRELGDVQLRLLKAAHAAPGQLGGHPHREHPKLLEASTAGESADLARAASKTN